ncbi:arginine--tRNA ligase [Methylocystis parvus]|uniref:Arginine--tRNA ligase n=1 Tax=Methylocystis parvus TaxID=134 RepID=A0A6B8M9W7_9HYPH|nr:arginine--tRNA ligase [Methylocystis parvus]QGM99215.1 arginine--tRNA ligase [Methylocystis parvus]WBK00404.1 arginine--tRNA ligase [Methylocystis parvus OBBP]
MNIFDLFHARIASILECLQSGGRLPPLDLSRFVVEPPKDAALGDLACNAAMVYAKEAKAAFANPREFAVAICYALAESEGVATAEVAGPGFINIRLKPEVFSQVLRAALSDPENFGRVEKGRAGALQGKVNVEYVSANPTGPMHVGHGRGAVFGDALANLLAFSGCEVTREYYINDAGAQVDVLARSAFMRYREALGETITIPEGLYPGDYLKPVGAALAETHGKALLDKPESEWLPIVKNAAIDAMMDMIRDDLAALNIRHEVFFSERTLHDRAAGPSPIDRAIDWLREKGLVYEGRLPPPKGQAPDDWEDREQTLFRSTDFGDDVDRALKKSDGSPTYFAADIAYHKDKIDRGFDTLVDVWGADHGGYVKRMGAAVAALSDRKATLDVKLCQLVKLMRNGEPVKMSKRAGDFVTLREVVDEVGVDAVRFMMLYRKNDAPLDFDLAKVIEQSKDNAVFYVQYAHARAKSVLRQALAAFPDLDVSLASLAKSKLELLTDEGELQLSRTIAQYPRAIEAAAAAHEPHRVAFYLHELSSVFHAHWNRGKDQPHLRFVISTERDLTSARVALVLCLTVVLGSGLRLLGVSAPDEMR